MIQIRLNSDPEQLFTTAIEGVVYNIRVISNSRTLPVWSMSISWGSSSSVEGISLASGVNLVSAFPEIPFNTMIVVNLDDEHHDVDANDLVDPAKLFILTDEEAADV